MPDPLDTLGVVADREYTHSFLFGSTDARSSLRHFSTHHEMRRQPTATLQLDRDLLPADPIDYLAPFAVVADHGEFKRPLFTGAVTKADLNSQGVAIEALSAVAFGETQTPAFSARAVPVFEIVHFLARTAGMRDEQLRIDGMDSLPQELFEVVVPLDGISVDERLRLSGVALLPFEVVRSRLGEGESELADALDGRSCAIAVVSGTRMLDAEETGLAAIDDALSWLTTRARYGAAITPDGVLQPFSRAESLSLPRRAPTVLVRGLTTQRRWIHDTDRAHTASELRLEPDHRFLAREETLARQTTHTREAIRALNRACHETDGLARVGALWDAIEFYVGHHRSNELFSKAERNLIKDSLPDSLSEQQAARVKNVIDQQLNNPPLRRRLEEVLDVEEVPHTDAEVEALFALRKLRNDAVHGKERVDPTEDQLQHATSFVARLIVNRVWRS